MGYDKNGRDKEGYDIEGYDVDGFDKFGYDRNGNKKEIGIADLKAGMTVYHKKYGAGKILRFEKERNQEYIVLQYPFDKEEYTYSFPEAFLGGFNEPFLSIEKSEKYRMIEESFSDVEDSKERRKYLDLKNYLRGKYLKSQLEDIKEQYKPEEVSYFNKSGFLVSKAIGMSVDEFQKQVEMEVEKLVENPYFCHIDYKHDSNLYVGKREIPGYVTDWADRKASMYYQYQLYIGNSSVALKLVREIELGAKKYLGYLDLYNALSNENSVAKYADERLLSVIKTNQEDKKIHDIIETIQQNQYEIITQDKDEGILVIGCAGSGKTMILMHRIRYIKYNNPQFDMNKIIVISPTDILGKESQELSKILDVGNIRQMTMVDFYLNISKELLNKYFDLPKLFENVQVVSSQGDTQLFERDTLDELVNKFNDIIVIDSDYSKEYRENRIKCLDEKRKSIYERYGVYKDFQHIHSIYRKAREDISKVGTDDISRAIRRLEKDVEERDNLANNLKMAELIYAKGGLLCVDEEADKEETYVNALSNTKKLFSYIDTEELYRYVKKHEIECNSITRLLQIINAFAKKEEKKNVTVSLMQRVRNELYGCGDKYIYRYIEFLRERLNIIDIIPKKMEMLEYLISNKFVRKQDKKSKLSDKQILDMVDTMYTFFETVQWKKYAEDPFADFDEYEDVQAKIQQLRGIEKGGGKWKAVFDMITDELHIKKYSDEYIVDNAQTFALCYILTNVSGDNNWDKTYLFIDEFQDFSDTEIGFLMDYMPNGVFNLFGDYLQCINPKGISDLKQFTTRDVFKKKYQINENYRNAKNITEYVNRKFGMSMMGIGVQGMVEEKDEIVPLQLENGDRGAIIVPDGYSGIIDIPKYDVHYYMVEKMIYRDSYNVIPVSQAKGLEFEKVIVISDGMTNNQKYVACTRAIKSLQIVT